MTAPGINIRLRVPLASVDNNVLPQPATTKPHAATNARRPASTAPFEVVCEVDEEASSLLAVAGPVRYNVSLRCRLSGNSWTLQRRYSEFYALHRGLVRQFYFFLPIFPPKDGVGGLRRQPEALAQRAAALAAYATALLARGDAPNSPEVSQFFELDRGLWRAGGGACPIARNRAARTLQSAQRRKTARRAIARLRAEAALHRAAVTLQSAQRRKAATAYAVRKLVAIFTLQAIFRNALNERESRFRAARALQRVQRRKAAAACATRRLIAILTLQAIFRNALNAREIGRLEARRTRRAALRLQARWRGFSGRRNAACFSADMAASRLASRAIELARLHREAAPPPTSKVLEEVVFIMSRCHAHGFMGGYTPVPVLGA